MHELVTLVLLLLPGAWESDRRDVEIPMRDGKALAADVFLPEKPGRYPAILVQTPYDKRHLSRPIAAAKGDGGEIGRGAVSDVVAMLDRERYAYVVVDWRGFHASRGAMAGVNRRRWRRGQDGYDCVEWIAKQPWSDGKVGTWGGSALGKQQFDTALEHPPHLVCCAPLIAAMGQRYEFYYDGGVYREGHVRMLDLLGYDASRKVRAAPRPDAPVWGFAHRLTYRPEKIEVPCLLITGWWDHFPDEIVETFEDIVDRGGPRAREGSKLLIGPWDHVSVGVAAQGDRVFQGAALASAKAARAFLDHWLLEPDEAWEKTPRVRFWQINEAKWIATERWSTLERTTTDLRLRADGTIAEEPDGGTRSYTYDPRKPSRTLGGANLPPMKHGPTVQNALEERSDVLAYSTGPLRTPLRINGNVTLTFTVTVDRECCDFTARLCDVRDGRAFLIADAARRVWDVEPGKPREVTLRFPATAVTTKELRIYLSSSNWPRYERNPHTGADHWDLRTAKPLKVTVHHEGAVLRIPQAEGR